MIYQLKSTTVCNNNCHYCDLIDKKAKKNKTLKVLKNELRWAKENNYTSVKLSCNTDIRKDFLPLLKLIKEMNFKKVALETNGRIFYYFAFVNQVKKYITSFEVYYDYIGIQANQFALRRQRQKIKGIKNILHEISINKIIIKIVLLGENLTQYKALLDQTKELGIKNIKFIAPFKLNDGDSIPSLINYVPLVAQAIKHARQNRLSIINDYKIEHNPYITQSIGFLNINNATARINYRPYSKIPRFSIVIPTYNKAKHLFLVVKSFIEQQYPKSKYEIIIVDDGSTDKTEQLLSKLKPDCNFKYIYWSRSSLKRKERFKEWAKFHNRAGLVRNIGIKEAKGDIILFNDDDIIAKPDCIRRHDVYHKKYPDIIVRGLRRFINDNSKINSKSYKNFVLLDKISSPEKNEYGKKLHCRIYDLSVEGWQRIITHNLSIRKKHLEKVGLFHQDSPFWGFEDIDLGIRLRKEKLKFMWDGNIPVYHLPHLTQTGSEINKLEIFWINLNILFRKYLDEDIYNLYKDIILYKLDEIINKKYANISN